MVCVDARKFIFNKCIQTCYTMLQMIRLRVMCLFLQCDQMGIMAVVIKLLPSFLC